MKQFVQSLAVCLLAFALGFAVMVPITAFTPLTDVYFFLDAASQLVVTLSSMAYPI